MNADERRFRQNNRANLGAVFQVSKRYDTAHGMAHRDLLTPGGEVIKTPLFTRDYNEALTFAENDLKANWALYKERFPRE